MRSVQPFKCQRLPGNRELVRRTEVLQHVFTSRSDVDPRSSVRPNAFAGGPPCQTGRHATRNVRTVGPTRVTCSPGPLVHHPSKDHAPVSPPGPSGQRDREMRRYQIQRFLVRLPGRPRSIERQISDQSVLRESRLSLLISIDLAFQI